MTLLLFSREHDWPPTPITVRTVLTSGRTDRRTLALADHVSPVSGRSTGVVLRRRGGGRWRAPTEGAEPVEAKAWFVGDPDALDVEQPFTPSRPVEPSR